MTGDRGNDGVTQLLNAWIDGNETARNDAMVIVYSELRRRAGYMRNVRVNNVTLKPTEIVHNAFLNFDKYRDEGWNNRKEFFLTFTKAMKNSVVDYLRAEAQTAKRGKDIEKVPYIDEMVKSTGGSEVFLEYIETAQQLAEAGALSELQLNIIDSRFLFGWNILETANQLGIGKTKVTDEWNIAKSVLYDEIASD